MPTTWFFDASGTQNRVLVLSGVGGSDTMWDLLHPRWVAAVNDLGMTTWHSADYFGRHNAFPFTLLNVILEQMSAEFNCVSVAIDREAAEEIRLQYPDLVPEAEKMLMDQCFKGLGIARDDVDEVDCIKVLFDRNEPFIRHLKADWQKGRKALKQSKEDGWPSQIHIVEPISSKHAGIQIADFLSWTVHRRYEPRDSVIDRKIETFLRLFLVSGRLRHAFLTQESIRTLYGSEPSTR